MRHRSPGERSCTYLVALEGDCASADDLRELAAYLSNLAVSDFDVVIVDGSRPPTLDRNRQTLRWVGRHVVAGPQHLTADGSIDLIRAAVDLATCDKVIVADAQVRYSDEAIDRICTLLDLHEVVEPQDYIDPLPWWSGIDAGRMLLHRSLSPLPDHGSTFGFRKNAIRGLRGLEHGVASDDDVRRLASQGAEVFCAIEVFVRRLPPVLSDWLRDLPRHADDDFSVSAKAAFFFGLLPITLVLILLGGARLAGGYAGAIAFASLGLAMRGRMGAAAFFPWRACLFAPVGILERSISVYWALLRRLSWGSEPRRIPIAMRSGQRAASGE
ncbi:MAG TPA: hypothetical protein VII12_18360 [Thermoanaerobaculia bacterium]